MNGLYIHIPFCKQKCNYCDFASYPSLLARSDEYIDALVREMKLYEGEEIDTVYFGGGTPSLLSEGQLGRLADALHKNFCIDKKSEITIEINPCTLTRDKAKLMYDIGINRVSLGAQSFSDAELKLLGRLHTSKDTIAAYELLRCCGFSNISLDLMYAIPRQSMKSLSTSIDQMLNLAPEHISCYGLKIEEGTPFHTMLCSGKIQMSTDDSYADMYELIRTRLFDGGYAQYELSNFAKSGYESRHNIKYWTMKDYIGIGLGAASFYKQRRYTKTADFEKYIKSFDNAEDELISYEDKMGEYMMLSLRLTQRGAIKSEFYKLFGKSIDEVFEPAIKKHLSLGMLCDRGDAYVLTDRAYYISNLVLCDFI